MGEQRIFFHLSKSLEVNNYPSSLFSNHLSLCINFTLYDLILGHLPCLDCDQQMVKSKGYTLGHQEDTLMRKGPAGQKARTSDSGI